MMTSPSTDVYINVGLHITTESYRGDASAPQPADNSDADSDSQRGMLPVVCCSIGYIHSRTRWKLRRLFWKVEDDVPH